MARLTKDRIIKQAMQVAHMNPPANFDFGRYDDIYELKKASMLKERPWPFTLKITRDLSSPGTPPDLGYPFVYELPADAIDVLALNPDQAVPSAPSLGSVRRALRRGYQIDKTADVDRNTLVRSYFYSNQLLHSDQVVTSVIYKSDVKEEDFSENFSLALIYTMAEFFAKSVQQRLQMAAVFAANAKRYHVKAAGERANSQETSWGTYVLNRWIDVFYGSIYERS